MSNIINDIDEIERKLSTFTEVRVDPTNWNIYYIEESTGEKWQKEYPNSEHHGGGAPQLRKIDKFPWE